MLCTKNNILYCCSPAGWTFCVLSYSICRTYFEGRAGSWISPSTFRHISISECIQLLSNSLTFSSLAFLFSLLFPLSSLCLHCLFSPSFPSHLPHSHSLSPAPQSCSQSAEFCSAGQRSLFILQLTVIHQRFIEAFSFHSALSPLPSACFMLFAGPTQVLQCFLQHDPTFFEDSPAEWHKH